MNNPLHKLISPQSKEVYSLIRHNKKSFTAKDIGDKLRIFPNAVYRAVKQLVDLGFVEEIEEYPIKYRPKTLDETIELLSLLLRQNLEKDFKKTQPGTNRLLELTFVRTRNELFEHANRDVGATKNSINLIVSGLEVSPETILIYKGAIEKGVKIRILVQRLDEVSKNMFLNWQKMGVEVKYFPNMEARIFIIDHKIVYLTSYDSENAQKAIGMRFVYSPFARLMDELFELRWKLAQLIVR